MRDIQDVGRRRTEPSSNLGTKSLELDPAVAHTYSQGCILWFLDFSQVKHIQNQNWGLQNLPQNEMTCFYLWMHPNPEIKCTYFLLKEEKYKTHPPIPLPLKQEFLSFQSWWKGLVLDYFSFNTKECEKIDQHDGHFLGTHDFLQFPEDKAMFVVNPFYEGLGSEETF